MITREQILKEIKEEGIETIKNKVAQKRNSYQQLYKDTIHELESSEILERKEDREEQSLSISKEANSIAREALRQAKVSKIIAIVAIIISATVAIISALIKKG